VNHISAKIRDFSTGSDFSLVLTEDNQLYAFGKNEIGELGLSYRSSLKQKLWDPVKLNMSLFGEEKIITIASGNSHSVVLTEKGSMFTWGNNLHHQLLREDEFPFVPSKISSKIVQQLNSLTESKLEPKVMACRHNTFLWIEQRGIQLDVTHSHTNFNTTTIDLGTGELEFVVTDMHAVETSNPKSETPVSAPKITIPEEKYNITNEYILTNFEFELEIGKGGEGYIYKYKSKKEDLPVAIKHMKIVGEEDYHGFQEHVKQVKELKHKHLIPYWETFCDEYVNETTHRYCHIVMPFYYQTLTELMFYHSDVDNESPIPNVLELAYQMASGFDYLHELDMVHRDIKADNILLESYSGIKQIKICDFGFMQSIHNVSMERPKSEDLSSTTGSTSSKSGGFAKKRSSLYLGSLPNVAPEINKRQNVQRENLKAADCFSFGVLLYNLFTYNLKIKLEKDQLYIHQALERDELATHSVIRSQLMEKGYSGLLSNLIISLLQKDWKQRPTMRKVRSVLDFVINGEKW